MQKIDNLHSPTTGGLMISRELDLVSVEAQAPAETSVVDLRVVGLCSVAIGLGATVSVAALALVRLIALFTNLAFYQQWSFEEVSPAGNSLGLWVIVVPMIGGLIVGLMARFGSQAIRGHGIPETMEQVLANHSRIPARMTFLKPLSAAIAIGTGGPFGAEGPIIATGGALGSLFGQFMSTSTSETQDVTGRGGGGRRDGDLWLPDCGGVAGGGAVAVRVSRPLDHPRCAGQRNGGRAAISDVRRAARV